MNLFTALRAAWPATLDAPAILTDAGTYTWADLDRASAMLANLLESLQLHGIDGRPPVVAAHVDKSVESLLLYLATLRAGCVYLPLNPAYRAAELEYFLLDAQPAVLVCRPEDQEWVIPLAGHAQVEHLFTLGSDRSAACSATPACMATRTSTLHASQAIWQPSSTPRAPPAAARGPC